MHAARDTRPLLLALLVSALLHGLFARLMPPSLLDRDTRVRAAVPGSITIEFSNTARTNVERRGRPRDRRSESRLTETVGPASPSESEPRSDARETTPSSTSQLAPGMDSPARSRQRASVPLPELSPSTRSRSSPPERSDPLDLRLPSTALDDLSGPQPDRESAFNGTVVDRALADRLSRLQRTQKSTRGADAPRSGRAAGDRWESFFELDGLCFRIIEADPLDPHSREQWYRVSCGSP